MKRLLPLFTGITLLCTATAAYAEPISQHYVGAVLERMENTEATDDKGQIAVDLAYWLDIGFDAVYQQVDTQIQIVEQLDTLTSRTACEHADIFLLMNKLKEIKAELQGTLKDKKSGDIVRLAQLLKFGSDRLQALLDGATDPEYRDVEWHHKQIFDPPGGWCYFYDSPIPDDNGTCKQVETDGECPPGYGHLFIDKQGCFDAGYVPPEEETEEEINERMETLMCPFDTDYLPPTVAGYGCDTDVLKKIEGIETATHELEVLEALLKERDAYLDTTEHILESWDAFDSALSELTEASANTTEPERPENFLAARDRKHIRRYWCNASKGEPEDLKPMPTGDTWPEGAARIEVRGPFSVGINDSGILKTLTNVLGALGLRRDQSDARKLPSEFGSRTLQVKAVEEQQGTDTIWTALNSMMRTFFSGWSEEQGALGGPGTVRGVDTAIAYQQAQQPLRKPMSEFMKFATEMDGGLRGYARNLAYYIRRSCVFRPCNDRIDQILKIVFTDSCFPYADGGGDYAACADAAKIEPQDGTQ